MQVVSSKQGHEVIPLNVDSHVPREGLPNRSVTEVAVGILINPRGEFLLTSRPQGKVYAGYWEFPGGKLEAGESVQQALSRELEEELGIEVLQAEPWQEELVDYPHALVRLHFYKVLSWAKALQMREGQMYVWEHLPVQVKPILPGAVPVLQWLAKESGFLGTTQGL
jgi:8-oxo-dGTP diphosphatase